MNKKIIKSFPFLKGRSIKSIDKTADSFMDLSNKMWGSIFVSAVALPLIALSKSPLDKNISFSLFLEAFVEFVDANLVIYLIIVGIGAFFAIVFRKYALDLYDLVYLQENVSVE